MTQGFEKLKTILPANQKAMTKASRAGDIPNISTEPCAETPAFNSHAMEAAFRDQAGMSAEHLNLAAAQVQQGPQEMREFRQNLEQTASQLRDLRMPDTRVNLDGQKIEIPFEWKQYAVDIDQEKYMYIMFGLLGEDRVTQVQRHATKSNQNNTPALWLNQAICVETFKPYVYNISKELDRKKAEGAMPEEFANVDGATDKQVSDYLDMALGSSFRSKLNQIAQANTLPLYVVFLVLVDEVLRQRGEVAIPVTAASLWENPFKEKKKEAGASA